MLKKNIFKAVFFIISIFIMVTTISAEENKNIPRLEVGTTFSAMNLYFLGMDLDLTFQVYQKGIHYIGINNSFYFLIPASSLYSTPPYTLFGYIIQLQYSLITKKGFWFGLELGLGASGEFKTDQIYNGETHKFEQDYFGTPYGLFTSGMRIGYTFEPKFNIPIKLGLLMGYRMQFPYNLTIKHHILIGVTFSYGFDLVKR